GAPLSCTSRSLILIPLVCSSLRSAAFYASCLPTWLVHTVLLTVCCPAQRSARRVGAGRNLERKRSPDEAGDLRRRTGRSRGGRPCHRTRCAHDARVLRARRRRPPHRRRGCSR